MAKPHKAPHKKFHVSARLKLQAALRLSPEAETVVPLPASADRPRRITGRADAIASGAIDPRSAQRFGGDVAAATIRRLYQPHGPDRLGRRNPYRGAGVSDREFQVAKLLRDAAGDTLADLVVEAARPTELEYVRSAALDRAAHLIDCAPTTGTLVAAAAFCQVATEAGTSDFALGLFDAITTGLAAAESQSQLAVMRGRAEPAIQCLLDIGDLSDDRQRDLIGRVARTFEHGGQFSEARTLYGALRDPHGAARVAQAYAARLLHRGLLDHVVNRLKNDGERESAFTRGEILVAAYSVADRRSQRDLVEFLAEDYLRFAEAIITPSETPEPIPLRIVAASRPATRKETAGDVAMDSRTFSAEVAEVIALGRVSGDDFGH